MLIETDHNPSQEKLKQLNVFSWPVWTKEISEFPWFYDTEEICYILKGTAIITPDNGSPVEIHENDLVVFPQRLSCTWKITENIKKHYYFK